MDANLNNGLNECLNPIYIWLTQPWCEVIELLL